MQDSTAAAAAAAAAAPSVMTNTVNKKTRKLKQNCNNQKMLLQTNYHQLRLHLYLLFLPPQKTQTSISHLHYQAQLHLLILPKITQPATAEETAVSTARADTAAAATKALVPTQYRMMTTLWNNRKKRIQI